jgi:hypothetical protein
MVMVEGGVERKIDNIFCISVGPRAAMTDASIIPYRSRCAIHVGQTPEWTSNIGLIFVC